MSAFQTRVVLGLVAAGLAVGCHPPDAGRADTAAADYLRVAAAEDARPTGGADLDTLLQAEGDSIPFLRAAAVRGLGRLENPAMLEHIAPLLADPDSAVRAQAANAAAQAVFRGAGNAGDAAASLLLARVGPEDNPWVRGVLARSLGRLRVDDTTRERASGALLALSHAGAAGAGGDAPPAQLLGVALGLESFVRGSRGRPTDPALTERLHALARYGSGSPQGDDSLRAVRIRELALTALGTARALDERDVHAALADPAVEVRLAAVTSALFPRGAPPAGARSAWSGTPGEALVQAALDDASPQLRSVGVRALARASADASTCARLESLASGDADTGVRLAALDALARPCPDPGTQTDRLAAAAATLVAGDDLAWHVPAHALVALAHVAPARARELLPAFVHHTNPFVRMYAARAAGPAGDVPDLRTLADDPVPNVRTEAVQQLATLQGPGADTVLVRVLARAEDPQLVLTAAHLLGKAATAADRDVADTALATLDRISRRRRETLRDARLALLGLIAEAADSASARRLEPYLVDYDAAVADSAAAVLRTWTGRAYRADPQPLPRLPLPTPEELRAMEGATVVLHMARGGSIDVRLLPWVAPTNAFRLYEQAKGGVLDGRTFHRVVPDFVIQGGSPDANEYSGNGAFTRDELGLPVQWRGTVGLSTRGRDTGDGQLYVNLVDNVRLDHDYTIFGVVTAGMGVADAVLEGDVIRRVEVRPGG